MRRRSRSLSDSASAKACPVFAIHTTQHNHGDVDFVARTATNEVIGSLEASRDGKRYQVVSVGVEDPYLRCGVGTKLYEAAAKYGCEQHKLPLTSDDLRTPFSQGFWEKQEAKGRATCARTIPGVTGKQGYRGPRLNRGGCAYYKLTCPVPETLSKRKRRR